MPFRGEKYDGGLFGSSANSSEWRNPLDNEGQTDRHAASKRAARKISSVDSEENPFQEEGEKDRYLITYSDLITLLLGLFIILYAISNIDAAKYRNVAAAMGSFFGSESVMPANADSKIIAGPKDQMSEQLKQLIAENNYSDAIQLEENERGIVVHILDDVLFPPGQAVLSGQSKIVLTKLAQVIKDIPNDLRIEGHTDNTPINTSRYPSNWHLSVDRALTTAYYFIQAEGIDPDKVSIVGYSEYRSIASNDTPEGRAKNRRVDLVILK